MMFIFSKPEARGAVDIYRHRRKNYAVLLRVGRVEVFYPAAHDYKDGKKIIYGEKTNVACKAIV